MLGTVVSCEARGNGGDSGYPGNWGGAFVERIVRHFQPHRVLDVMAGSGTTGDVCNRLGIAADCYDLQPAPPRGVGAWDVLADEPGRGGDLVLAHAPYWDLYRYSTIWGDGRHPADLSCVAEWPEFLALWGRAMARMLQWVDVGGYVGVLVGSIRRRGRLYDMAMDMPRPAPVFSRIVKVQHHTRSEGRRYSGQVVLIEHEDFLVFRRDNAYVFQGCVPRQTPWDLRESPATTWLGAVRAAMLALGGEADLSTVYGEVEAFAVARRPENRHWREKVRQVLQTSGHFEPVARGRWRLRGEGGATGTGAA